MTPVSFTEFRQSLAGYLDRVCDDHAPLTVTRQRGRAVVVLSAEEYESMAETLHLIQSPANAARLTLAMEELASGAGVEVDFPE